MSGEEIATKIKEIGAIIAAAKADKKPIEEWKPFLDEMLVLKVRVWCRCAKRMFMFSTKKEIGSIPTLIIYSKHYAGTIVIHSNLKSWSNISFYSNRQSTRR